MGELDPASLQIGRLIASVEALGQSFDREREVGDARHSENTRNLERISLENTLGLERLGNRVGSLENTVKPLAVTVGKMEPVVESMTISRWKLVGALSALVVVAGVAGWILDKFGGWFFSKFP